jgi:HIV Tat-specific factor 1
VLAREERRNKKRKKGEADFTSNGANGKPGTSKPPPPPSSAKKTAVWISNLPPNTTVPLLASVFSKAGVLLIGDDGQPRIKLYYDEEGKFKGEALVMYFKEGSVDLAIRLLDDTELEMGGGYGNMRVKEAEYDKSAKADHGERKPGGEEKKNYTTEEKQRMSKRIKAMQRWILFEVLLTTQQGHLAFG